MAETVFDKCIESGEKVKAYSYELLEDNDKIVSWMPGMLSIGYLVC